MPLLLSDTVIFLYVNLLLSFIAIPISECDALDSSIYTIEFSPIDKDLSVQN